MVFYLKYRPQKIKDLDSSNVRDTLNAVFSSSKKKSLSFHAFLFTGPKGLGKTSAARIVAKFLNCEKNPSAGSGRERDLEPCNKCSQCTSITNGNNLDIVEIDAASNRGIDEIRELKERINLATMSASYKVYIIDEVHMLTTEAFNALLKTLEEPPVHAVFILCTTEPNKVPATIISRCLHISFKTASEEELIRSFKRIITGEKLNIDKEALSLIAHLSDGSFRDGSKILQELSIKAGKKKITANFVKENFKTASISGQVSELIDLLEIKDTKKSLDLIQKITGEGVEMKYFVEELISGLHLILLSKITESQPKADPPLEEKFTLEEIKKLLHLLITASSQLKYSVLPQLPLELAIVEYTTALSSARQLDDSSVRGPASVLPPVGAHSATASSNSLRAVGNPSTSSPLSNFESGFLNDLILKVNPQNRSIAGLLRGVSLKSTNGKKVIIETKYKFHKEKLEEKSVIDLIEKTSSEILGKKVKLDIILNS